MQEGDQNNIISQDEYFKYISELQDFLLELHDFKKKRAQQYLFSVLQTLFLLFCSAIFYILHMKIDFIKEIVFLPLYCICVKDGIQSLKTIKINAKFFKKFKFFISKYPLLSSNIQGRVILKKFQLSSNKYLFSLNQ